MKGVCLFKLAFQKRGMVERKLFLGLVAMCLPDRFIGPLSQRFIQPFQSRFVVAQQGMCQTRAVQGIGLPGVARQHDLVKRQRFVRLIFMQMRFCMFQQQSR